VEDEINAAENFIPKYVKDFVDCVISKKVKNEIGEDPHTKLFCGLYVLIWKFHEFYGAISELHLKNKT